MKLLLLFYKLWWLLIILMEGALYLAYVCWGLRIDFHIHFSCREGCEGSSSRRSLNNSRFSTTSDCPLAPYQDGTKQGRACNHTTWRLVGVWSVTPRTLRKNPVSPACTWNRILSVSTQGSLNIHEDWIKDRFKNRQLCVISKLPLCDSGAMKLT